MVATPPCGVPVLYLYGRQRGEAAGVEKLDQGGGGDSAAHPEQQGEGGADQIETSGLQAGSTAA